MLKRSTFGRRAFGFFAARRTFIGVLALFFAGVLYASAAPALSAPPCNTCGNGDVFSPSSSGSGTPTSFTVTIYGDYLASFGITSGSSGTVQEPPSLDPFCPTSQTSCPVQVSYSSSPAPEGSTTIVYSGNQGLFPNSQQSGAYHFGWVPVGCYSPSGPCGDYVPTQPLASKWTFAKNRALNVGMLAVECTCKVSTTSKNVRIAIVYYQASFPKAPGSTFQVWNAVAYVPKKNGAQPGIKFYNYESAPIEVSNTGIMLGITPPTDLAGWFALVAQMNYADMPPPGSSGSAFVALTKPPKSILKPRKLGSGSGSDLSTGAIVTGRPARATGMRIRR